MLTIFNLVIKKNKKKDNSKSEKIDSILSDIKDIKADILDIKVDIIYIKEEIRSAINKLYNIDGPIAPGPEVDPSIFN